ncbi:ankyrin repeat domain-containing protein [Photobacterium sp. BZF1]|uniref:ankyrin repeat domain-containing protein n=1 Tax=Photobacterium sp. BZF1 TaxID=1904457 RepID=UPI0016538E1E|nr:ankyrin repeat domain-containing protein [Photobacterium sp. BZF1]MBC7003656.1 ankyrin repeat domain-containing protein [Photobacterium sp. BZF1]
MKFAKRTLASALTIGFLSFSLPALSSQTDAMRAADTPTGALYQPSVEKDVFRNLTPLHLAVVEGNLEQAKKLIAEGADVNALDPLMGNAPIHFAAQAHNVEMLKMLVEHGAFVNLQSVRLGASPLMLAVWYRNIEGVEYLLSLPDTDTTLVAAFGMSAKDFNDFGPNPEDKAAIADIAQINQLFDKRTAELNSQAKNDSAIFTALVLDTESTDEEKLANIQALIKGGADVNAVSPVLKVGSDFHTALLVAARNGNYEIAKALLEAGADQTIPGNYMAAIPLHKAAYFGRADMLTLLSQYEGFKEVLDAMGPNNGYTPLHDAIWHGHTEAAKVLIEAGADTSIVAFDGLTPKALAEQFGYSDIVELLEDGE